MSSSIDRFLERPAPQEPQEPQRENPEEWLDGVLGKTAENRVNVAKNFGENDPKKSTRVLQLSRDTGLPHDIVERNLDTVGKQFGDVTSGGSSTTPAVTRWLAENPHHYPAAKNDIPHLNFIDQQIQNIKDQFNAGLSTVRMRFLAEKDFKGTITPKESAELDALQSDSEKAAPPGLGSAMLGAAMRGLPGVSPLAVPAAELAAGMPAAAANQIPIQGRTVGASLEGASWGAIGGALLGAAGGPLAPASIPAGAAAGAAAGAWIGGALEAGKMEAFTAYPGFKKMLDENGNKIPESAAKAAAVVTGVVNGALEMLELHQISKFIPGIRSIRNDAVKTALRAPSLRNAVVEAVKDAGATGLWEGGTEFAQQAVQTTAGEIATMASDGSINRLSTPEILHRIVAHAPEWVQAGAQGFQAGFFLGAGAHLFSLPGEAARARQAQKNADFFQAIGDAAAKTELVKTLPEKMQEAVERMTENGPVQTVHAPIDTWNEYWQSQNVDPAEVAREVTGSDEAYNQAIAMGADLEIPTSRYASKIAPTEHNKFFVRELRLAPDQMNLRESEDFVKSLGETETAPSSDVETAATALTDRITKQLVDTGKMDEVAARTQAETFYGKPFRTLAARGVPIEELNRVFDRLNVAQGTTETAAPNVPLADTMRRPSGSFRNASLVSDEGLLDELDNLANRMQKASERAQYNYVTIEGTSQAEVVVPMASRKGKGASRQAKALQNLEQMRVVRDRIHDELKARGYSDEQINEMQLARRETRDMAALERDEQLSESDLSDLPDWARELVDASFNPDEFEQAVQSLPESSLPPLAERTADDYIKALRENGNDGAADNLARFMEGSKVRNVVFHGTTGNFDIFDTERANPESDFGAGIYFSNTPEDVAANYAGRGPDLSNKIELRAERLHDELVFGKNEEAGRARLKEITGYSAQPKYGTPEYEEYSTKLREYAAKEIGVQHEGATLPVFLSMKNPVVVGHALTADAPNETFLTFESEQDEEGDFTGNESGTLVDFIVALRNVASRYNDGNVEGVIDEILGEGYDGGISASRLVEMLKENQEYGYFTDDNGNLASHEITRQAFEEAGFDGIVDNTVDQKFGSQRRIGQSMRGMQPETVHYIAFAPEQVKSATGNRGTFDPNNPNILYQSAYHGSPHIFDRFDLQKIGTGEGAAVYGWGLYFAGKKEVAEYYRDSLSPQEAVVDGRAVATIDGYNTKERGLVIDALGYTDPQERRAADAVLYSYFDNGKSWPKTKQDIYAIGFSPAFAPVVRRVYGEIKDRFTAKALGRVYKTEIPEDDTMLHWDTPLSQQPAKVQEALRSFDSAVIQKWREARKYEKLTGRQLYDEIANEKGGEEQASRHLAALGVNGIKYQADQLAGAGHKKSFNYVIFDDNLIQIADYEQQNQGAPRGRIRFFQSGKINIELLDNANLSTFIHETGHLYTHLLSELSQTNPQIAKDYQLLREWVGAKEDDELSRDQQEQIARGFEAYVREGNAPSPELHGAFARMKAWLKWIYKIADHLNVHLTDEVRGVFDRLIASDEEIDAAKKGLTPLIADPQSFGLGGSQAQTYNDAVAEADAAAREQVEQKLLSELKRETTRLWKDEFAKTREVVAKEVSDDPAWRALSILQRGTLPDGSPLPNGMEPFKLSRQGVIQVYGGREIFLRELPFGIYRKEGGIHPNAAAELLGFESGAALLKALPARRGPTIRQHIDQLTTERMKAEHGDMLNDGTLPEEALKAVHSDKRARILQLELKYLAENKLSALKGMVRTIARRIPTTEAVKNEAERIIGQKTGRNLSPNTYLVAERKAARNAVEALTRGDFQQAFDEKLKEQFNHALYNAAMDARDENERIARYLSTFDKKEKRQQIGRAGGSYLAQIDALLDRIDFRRSITNKALDRRESLRQFAASPESFGIEIPEYLLDEANQIHYSEMTHSELVGLRDTVRQIEHLATFKDELMRRQRARTLQEAATESADVITDNAKRTLPDNVETRLPGENRGRLIQGILASHRKYASMMRQMGGFEEGGPLFENFVRPFDEAGNDEAVRNEKAHNDLDALFGLYSAAEQRDFYTVQAVADTNLSLSKMGRLVVALNWGNETNRERILSGYGKKGFSEANVQKVLGSLDERDWKFVQGVWDFVNGYWPELEKLGQELWGVPPEKVEASPFTVVTSDGKTLEIKGGYYPLKYDDRQSSKAYADRAKEAYTDLLQGAAIRATTRKGMLKERVDGVTQPVRLDFGVLFQHVNDVIHTITHTRAVMDVDRLLKHELVDEAIKRHYGDVVHKDFVNYVRDVAAGGNGATTAIEQALQYGRQGVVIAGLGLNLWTATFQPIGLSNGMARLGNGNIREGAKWMWQGISQWVSTSPKKMSQVVEEVHAKSDFMRLRHKTLQREINEIQNSIGLNGGGKLSGWVDEALEKVTGDRVTREGIASSFFYFIGKAQMVADIPTWLGAYNKFIAEGREESDAVALADRVVLDSQGGGQIKDLAGVQRGPGLLKIFTTFYSYFNVVYNQLAESTARTDLKNPAEVGRMAVDYALIVTIPVVLQRLLGNALKGDDSDDPLWEELLKDHAAYLTSTMVLLREASSAFQGFYGYSGPAGTRFIGDFVNLAKQVTQGEADTAFWKALNRSSGILFHYPSVQVERTVRGIAALYAGDTNNPLSLIFGPSKK